MRYVDAKRLKRGDELTLIDGDQIVAGAVEDHQVSKLVMVQDVVTGRWHSHDNLRPKHKTQ